MKTQLKSSKLKSNQKERWKDIKMIIFRFFPQKSQINTLLTFYDLKEDPFPFAKTNLDKCHIHALIFWRAKLTRLVIILTTLEFF